MLKITFLSFNWFNVFWKGIEYKTINHKSYNVNHFVNESINSLWQEVIKVCQTVLYGLHISVIDIDVQSPSSSQPISYHWSVYVSYASLQKKFDTIAPGKFRDFTYFKNNFLPKHVPTETAARTVLWKKMFLKTSQSLQENTCPRVWEDWTKFEKGGRQYRGVFIK